MKPYREIIWDIPTRVIHWVIATAVLLNLFVLEEGDPPHRYLGYAAVVAVLLRGVWGFRGSVHSRFSSFPLRPLQLFHFVRGFFRRPPQDYSGHNPMASLVYILIWLAVLALGLTGWMMGLDAFWGDETLEEIHELISDAVMILVAMHLMGILIDAVKFRRKTWVAMITGRKG